MTKLFFPNSLKEYDQWIVWKKELNDKGKSTKVLYRADGSGYRASSTDSRTWSSFRAVATLFNNNKQIYSGIGFVLSENDPFVFIDIDHGITDGIPDQRTEDIIKGFSDQFVEISQSGSGIHIICKGHIDRSIKNSANGIEMYSAKRFIAMTGNALIAGEPHDDQESVDYVFNRYKTKIPVPNMHTPPLIPALKTDKSIINRASEKSPKFYQLYSGNWQAFYKSQSEADLALCIDLAFWTDANPAVIDRIFRTSNLFRSKWNRADYRISTIEKACSFCTETISEYKKRRNDEKFQQIAQIW